MDTLFLRPERMPDQLGIYDVHQLAFGQDNEARLVDLLRQGPTFIPELSIVAIRNGHIVGHILFTTIAIVRENGARHESLALAPMAVLPEFQNQGIGGRLVEVGLEEARQLGFGSVVVVGHEHYYPRFGFRPAREWGIRAPFEVPDPNFMALELTPGALKHVGGMVDYPPAFSEV